MLRDVGESWREPQEILLPVTLKAALELFRLRGFHGSSVRQIAEAAGVTVPTLYYRHQHKEGMLAALLKVAMADLLARAEQALAAAGDDPARQLSNVVYAGVLHTTTRSDLAGLHGESRHLLANTPDVGDYRARRRRFEDLLKEILARGVAAGDFRMDDDVDDMARFLLGAIQAIPTWYRRDGPRPPQALAEKYVRIALQSVGAPA